MGRRTNPLREWESAWRKSEIVTSLAKQTSPSPIPPTAIALVRRAATNASLRLNISSPRRHELNVGTDPSESERSHKTRAYPVIASTPISGSQKFMMPQNVGETLGRNVMVG